MTRLLPLAAAGLGLFLAVFLLALRVHFPGEAARDRIAFAVQEASGGGWLLSAAPARPWHLGGLRMDDAVIYKAEKRGRADAEPEPFVRLDSVAVRPLWLALLRGEGGALVRMGVLGGDLDVAFRRGDRLDHIELEGGDLDLSRLPLQGDEWSIDATGTASLKADLRLGTEDVKESEGTLELSIDQLVFQQATIMGMSLEPTPFQAAVLSFEIEDGRAQVREGRFESEPVRIEVSGEIVLNKSWERSRLRLDFKVNFNEQFDKLAQMAPNLKSARDDQGAYHFKLTGTVATPRFREDRLASRSRPSRSTSLDEGGEDEAFRRPSPMDDEEAERRRAERRERIAERRRKMQEEGGNPGPGLPMRPGDLGPMPGPGGKPMALPNRFGELEQELDVGLDRAPVERHLDIEEPAFDGPPGGPEDLLDEP